MMPLAPGFPPWCSGSQVSIMFTICCGVFQKRWHCPFSQVGKSVGAVQLSSDSRRTAVQQVDPDFPWGAFLLCLLPMMPAEADGRQLMLWCCDQSVHRDVQICTDHLKALEFDFELWINFINMIFTVPNLLFWRSCVWQSLHSFPASFYCSIFQDALHFGQERKMMNLDGSFCMVPWNKLHSTLRNSVAISRLTCKQ